MEEEVGLQTQLPLPPPLESPPEQPSDAEDERSHRACKSDEVDWSFGDEGADAQPAAAEATVSVDDSAETQQELDAANTPFQTASLDASMNIDDSTASIGNVSVQL